MVLQCQADGREAGSLFSILDRTQTAFGRRVLAGWVRQPLLSPEDITARQDAVEELVADPPSVMERLRPALRDLKDLDPATASLHHRRIQPSRLLSLLGTMRKVFGIFHPPTVRGADKTEGAGSSQQGGGPRSAVLLDALADVPANMAPVIARYLGELNAEAAASCVRTILRKPSLQWKTLRTGATSTVEYLVELRKSEAKKLVPSDWMQAWAELVSQVDEECYAGFRTAVQALGTLDALLSLAVVAKLPGYVRPKYRPTASDKGDESGGDGGGDDEADGVDEIVLRGARHPTVERVLEGGFVPNDVSLRRGECLVVTGPNMGGKSSTVRMAALICIMGQVELWHTSYIIKHATRRSLVVLDELGRGTSTHDGVAIALATLRHVVRDIGCATLFVTHYPQVADLASDKSLSGTVKNAHMSFIEDSAAASTEETPVNEQEVGESAGGSGVGNLKRNTEARGVTFLYRLVVGQAHKSYGLNVARAAGMDEALIELAARKSAEMRDRGLFFLSGET
ncbi:unnamed protein product [Ectocarpus sp. CCAP 1310/34]|nr:unnamed protein product [Ectocarpus sp. CCAP 1310/34]